MYVATPFFPSSELNYSHRVDYKCDYEIWKVTYFLVM